MPRVLGIDVPDNKRLVIALTYIYGIGKHRSEEICRKLQFNESMRARDLKPDDIAKLTSLLQNDYILEGDLRRSVQNNIKRLVAIQCHRGIRHRLGLPVRGQRTRTNARTRKGRKKTIAGKKKAPSKK